MFSFQAHYGAIAVAGNVPYKMLSNKIGLSSGLNPRTTGTNYSVANSGNTHFRPVADPDWILGGGGGGQRKFR